MVGEQWNITKYIVDSIVNVVLSFKTMIRTVLAICLASAERTSQVCATGNQNSMESLLALTHTAIMYLLQT